MSQARNHGGDPSPTRLFGHRSAGPLLPVLIVCVVVLVDLAGGAGMTWLPLLVAGPALAATTNGPRGVLCV
ncbi:serine/threonine-protein phosphatase, partial [Streptomyces sp. NPDC002491]